VDGSAFVAAARTDREVHVVVRAGGRELRPTIWIVTVGEQVFVRSYQAGEGHWYQRAVTSRELSLELGGELVTVLSDPVDDAHVLEEVSKPYLAKYDGPWLSEMVSPRVVATTLRLVLRSERDERPWQRLSQIVEIRSAWLSMVGERLRDGTGCEVEYWRVEKPDSVLVITVHDGRLVLPARSYRAGVGRVTLDFAGGRLEDPGTIAETSAAIVRREFNLRDGDIVTTEEVLNPAGWDVDSSTSSQRVYGVVMELSLKAPLPDVCVGASYPATDQGGRELLRDLDCVQCRVVLHEWLDRGR
jgi:hypothetical protein